MRRTKLSFLWVLLLGLAPVLSACGDDDDDVGATADTGGDDMGGGPGSLLEVAEAAGSFNTLLAAVDAAGLDTALEGPGPLTVFAPTDDAFEALASALGVEVSDLLALPNLGDILLYHVIADGVAAADVISADSWPTLNGVNLYVNATDDGVFLNDTAAGGVAVTATDVLAANGVIHVIDGVLIPPTLDQVAELEGAFSTLLAAAATAQLDSETTVADVLADSGADLTVFAPTDDAFAALLGELGASAEDLLADPNLTEYLLYHVVAGSVLADDVVLLDGMAVPTLLEQDPDGSSSDDNYYARVIIDVDEGVAINDATVTAVDVVAANGVIHVVDTVLFPTDAVAVAAGAGLSDLLSAATEAGLDDDLSAPNGPFTIFAPPNTAFQALLDSEASWSELGDIPIDTLTAVLQAHVVPGYFTAADLSDGIALDTLAGDETLNVTIAGDGSVSLDAGGNSANVTAVDVPASNAIIHIIDAVIVPGS